jgi:hypothetical protein
MLSEKQLIANRNNCLKSTGPRTPEGKRSASRNAVRHGLLSDSAEVLLKGENHDEFDSFHQNLLINLDPQGQLEVLLAERITGFFWKLKRAGRMEKGLLDILCNPSADSDPSSKKNALPFVMIMTKTYDNPSNDPEYQEFRKLKEQQTAACGLDVSEGKIIDKESFDSIQALQKTDKQPALGADCSSAESLGKAIQHDFKSGSLLERLLRYEGQIERGLYRALTELQKFQFIRQRNEAINVDVGEASVLHNEKPNEAILQAPSVPVASKRSEDGSEGIEVLPGIHNTNLNQPSSSEQRNQSTQENSANIQSTIHNIQSTESVVPASPEPEKPNEAISEIAQPPSAVFNVGEVSLLHNEKPTEAISVGANPRVCPVAQPPSAVSNVTEASCFGDSPGHPEPSEGSDSVASRDASDAKQPAAGSPNPDTGYFYHSPPFCPVPPQRHASHSGMSLSHLSDEQLDWLSKQIV